MISQIVLNAVRQTQITLGERVAVVGLGLLGQLAARFSQLNGATSILGIDLSQKRINIAEKMGVTNSFLGPIDQAIDDIESIMPDGKANVVFEVTGHPLVLPHSLKLAAKMGRFSVLGSPRGKSSVDFHELIHCQGLVIYGAHNSTHPEQATSQNPWTRDADVKLTFSLIANGLLELDNLISHRYKWCDAGQAYEMLLNDRSELMGVILDWE
jgi:threonine dehydrogenase-like Zn-dependent dehydrogenase